MDSELHGKCNKNSKLVMEEVRTLFVSGLPMDIKQREIHLLFRPFSGYEGTILKLFAKAGKSPQPIAFVTFQTRKQAKKAMDELQGVKIDPNLFLTLRLEFAHTNSRSSPKQSSCNCFNNLSSNQDVQYFVLSPPTNFYPLYGINNWDTFTSSQLVSNQCCPPQTSAESMISSYSTMITSPVTTVSSSHPLWQPVSAVIPAPISPPVPPCSTLFVANLEKDTTVQDMTKLFISCPGFVKAKMYSKCGPPVCFVEFMDVESAQLAMRKFQGFTTHLGGSGFRIEFAKQRMADIQIPTVGLNNSTELRGSEIPSTLQYDTNVLEATDTTSSSGTRFRKNKTTSCSSDQTQPSSLSAGYTNLFIPTLHNISHNTISQSF